MAQYDIDKDQEMVHVAKEDRPSDIILSNAGRCWLCRECMTKSSDRCSSHADSSQLSVQHTSFMSLTVTSGKVANRCSLRPQTLLARERLLVLKYRPAVSQLTAIEV